MFAYNPDQISIFLNGLPITGKGEDEFLSITRAEDDTTITIGADGEAIVARNKNDSAQITITLLASSASNDIMMAAYAAYKSIGAVSSIMIKDLNGRSLFMAERAVPTKFPDVSFSKNAPGDVAWTWVTDRLVATLGGSTLAPVVPA
jgi:hypothetical protein